MPPNFKVAFIGDQGISGTAEAVLSLIAAEGADMAIHLGDFGYEEDAGPQRAIEWDAQITRTLGPAFPYFGVVGNNDLRQWTTYRQLLEDRLAMLPGASCLGEYGVMSACSYRGLFFILSGSGTLPSEPDYQPHIDYIHDQLAQDDSIWRICAWHKNQNAAQVGHKADEVGWGPYEACRRGRAIVATAHEHSYSRTKTISNFRTQSVDEAWNDPDYVRVSEGSTFAFVSGIGGRSIRDQERCFSLTESETCSAWATIYTSDQGANYGALFIVFNVDGEPTRARGYFKNIDGEVVDSFTIVSQDPVG